MKVKGQPRKYKYLTKYTLEVLDNDGISHSDLVLYYKKGGDRGKYGSLGWKNDSLSIRNNPTIALMYKQWDDTITEKDRYYIIAHEIGHYKDWLNGNLIISFFTPPAYLTKAEKRANKYARGITKHTPKWLPRKLR